MITSDRRARMLLGSAMDAGDPAVADLVQNLGADAAWAKITEGALGEPAAERAALLSLDGVERAAKAAAMRFVVPGDEEWMIFDTPSTSSAAAVSRWGCGCVVQDIWRI